jgi:5-methylcytosine-specific restriction endonuclease McrA
MKDAVMAASELLTIESEQFDSFSSETEARWRLVEHAWNTGIAKRLIEVEYDSELKALVIGTKELRTNITSCRDSLNGYQKGRCFYCFSLTSLASSEYDGVDVDHFLPWVLNDKLPNINEVWNLVLACSDCNRGVGGKFANVPTIDLLKRLHKRNEYFINSHLPLRETLISQTRKQEETRKSFLQNSYRIAKEHLIHEWQPELKGSSIF